MSVIVVVIVAVVVVVVVVVIVIVEVMVAVVIVVAVVVVATVVVAVVIVRRGPSDLIMSDQMVRATCERLDSLRRLLAPAHKGLTPMSAA